MPAAARPVPRLRSLRQQRALSQRDLAALAGVGKTTILMLESGRQGAYPKTIRRLAHALGVSPAALLDSEATEDQTAIGPTHRPADPRPDAGWAVFAPLRAPGLDPALLESMIGHIPRTRAEIDADLAEMANDSEYQAEARQIMAEFAQADWEAFRLGERTCQQQECEQAVGKNLAP
jgi:transcriptional regulator with XRE-family HTH domain